MTRVFARIFLFAGLICLTGCAAKNVVPVQMTQSGDESLDCAALSKQIAANQAAAADFVHKNHQVEQANVAKGIGGAIPYVGILIMLSSDLSNQEQIKARALIDRDEQLGFLAKQRGCTQ